MRGDRVPVAGTRYTTNLMCACVPQCLTQLVAHRVFTKSIRLSCDEQCTKIIFASLDGNYALCLLGQLLLI